MSNGRILRLALLGSVGLALVQASGAGIAPAAAQDAVSDAQVRFDIPGGSLSDSLRAFAAATGLQLVYNANLDTAAPSAGVKGTMSAREALARLLAGTGLTFRFVNAQTVTIDQVSAVDGERVLGAVRVEGAQTSGLAGSTPVNGINGSRDVTATEGTGSYTSNALTIGSKIPTSSKEVTASISVVTDQRLKDQAITDVNAAIAKLPGIYATPNTGTGGVTTKFYSRGFAIDTYQIDGGPGIRMGGDSLGYSGYSGPGQARQLLVDLSMYDHVELIRGADGLGNYIGNPGGVINLVRKKPLDHGQVLVSGEIGSWSKYRASVDVTSPLTKDEKLRGRFVATFQDNKFFYDVAQDQKTIVYGIAEYDLTGTTLFSAGANYQHQTVTPNYVGVPRYTDGTDIGLPRSTCFCSPRTKNDLRSTEVFGNLEQKIGPNWQAKLSFTKSNQSLDRGPYLRMATVPDNVVTPRAIFGYGSSAFGYDRQSVIELTVNGEFKLFGQKQKILIGANKLWASGNVAGDATGIPSGTPDTIFGTYFFKNIKNFDSSSLPIAQSFGQNTSDNSFTKNNISGAYISVDLQPVGGLHLLTSLRYTQFSTKYRNEILCTQDLTLETCKIYPSFSPSPVPNTADIGFGSIIYVDNRPKVRGHNFAWPPSASLRYDVSKRLSLYVSYADIYQLNTFKLKSDYTEIQPTTGANREVGLKWTPREGMNVSLAAYSNYQKGFIEYAGAPSDPSRILSPSQCCFVSDPNAKAINEGFDLQFAGQLAKGVQVDASVTWVNQRYMNTDKSIRANLTQVPAWQYRLWVTKNFVDGGLTGLTVGGGFTGQSSHFVSDTYCAQYTVEQDDLGRIVCAPGKTMTTNFVAPGYLVFSGIIAYNFGERLRAQLNVENIFDKRYYINASGLLNNYYGSPRGFNLTLSAKY